MRAEIPPSRSAPATRPALQLRGILALPLLPGPLRWTPRKGSNHPSQERGQQRGTQPGEVRASHFLGEERCTGTCCNHSLPALPSGRPPPHRRAPPEPPGLPQPSPENASLRRASSGHLSSAFLEEGLNLELFCFYFLDYPGTGV
ncbi:hypothetical protein MC885_000326 [Smutsia gigantea]|nr:hypothetical protein MC885_000326 [Smutsia gigantea]